MHLHLYIKKNISQKTAAISLLFALLIMLVFHLLVFVGFIPFKMVWGGRLANKPEMLRFETISIVINLLLCLVVAIHTGYLKISIAVNVTRMILWVMVLIFVLNTVGNFFSENKFEQIFFTPLTFVLSLFSYRLALKE